MTCFQKMIEVVSSGVDGLGVLVVVIGAVIATGRFLHRCRQRTANAYALYRQDLGRAILLGLEFLVAGDIIRTVVVAPTLENVAILGLIVLIRTFLSMSLQLEVEGRWPWQQRDDQPAPGPPAAGAGSGESATPGMGRGDGE